MEKGAVVLQTAKRLCRSISAWSNQGSVMCVLSILNQ